MIQRCASRCVGTGAEVACRAVWARRTVVSAGTGSHFLCSLRSQGEPGGPLRGRLYAWGPSRGYQNRLALNLAKGLNCELKCAAGRGVSLHLKSPLSNTSLEHNPFWLLKQQGHLWSGAPYHLTWRHVTTLSGQRELQFTWGGSGLQREVREVNQDEWFILRQNWWNNLRTLVRIGGDLSKRWGHIISLKRGLYENKMHEFWFKTSVDESKKDHLYWVLNVPLVWKMAWNEPLTKQSQTESQWEIMSEEIRGTRTRMTNINNRNPEWRKGTDWQVVTKELEQEDHPLLKKYVTLHSQWSLWVSSTMNKTSLWTYSREFPDKVKKTYKHSEKN